MESDSGDEKRSKRSREEGNTNSSSPLKKKQNRTVKQVSPAKRWCFTYNGYSELDMDSLEDELNDAIPVLIFQTEVSKKKTKHLQGYLEFFKKSRPMGIVNNILEGKPHWEVAKGDIWENHAYCSKDHSYDGIRRYERGFPRRLELMTRADMRPNQLAIADEYKEFEDPKFGRDIHWYWEEKGGWGKSILCKYMVDCMGAILLGGANKDALYGIAQMVEKSGKGPDIVIFDIPRVNKGGISYQTLEYVKNGMFFNSKYESAMVRFNSPHVIVFANVEPEYEKLSSDRWCVKDLRIRQVEQDRSKQSDIESGLDN